MTTYYCDCKTIILEKSKFGTSVPEMLQVYGDDVITHENVFSSCPDKIWTMASVASILEINYITKLAGTSSYRLNKYVSKDYYSQSAWKSQNYLAGTKWNPTDIDIYFNQLCTLFNEKKNGNCYVETPPYASPVGFGDYSSVNLIVFFLACTPSASPSDTYFFPVFYQGNGAAGYRSIIVI